MTKKLGEVIEERPRQAASLWERVLRQMPAAVAVVDADTGRVVLASGRAEEGEGPPGLPGPEPGAALRPDGTPYAAEEWPLARSLRSGETVAGEEVALRREDGSTAVYLLHTAPVRDAAGRIVAAVALWTEVTGARRAAAEREHLLGREREAREEAVLARTVAEAAQLEAQAADSAKSSFLASMSHEIRTPINAIMGYTDLLDLGLSGPVTEGQHAQLARIRDSSRHLLSLVNEVLDVAKIDAGEMEVDREPGRLADAVDAALDMVRPQAAERGLELSERCEGDPDAVFVGDGGRVRQIAANLLSNAVKFTPAGGRVRVSCGVAPHPHGEVFATHAGPWAYLAVEDNGIGIPPEVTARIFEPFVQADAGRTRRAGGTGLGLTISRKLARLMKGDLTVRSTPGEGSTFTLWLPAADPAEPPAAEPAAGRAAPVRIRGIAGLGMRMLDEVDSVGQSLVVRLRAAPPVPHLDAPPRFHAPQPLRRPGHGRGAVPGHPGGVPRRRRRPDAGRQRHPAHHRRPPRHPAPPAGVDRGRGAGRLPHPHGGGGGVRAQRRRGRPGRRPRAGALAAAQLHAAGGQHQHPRLPHRPPRRGAPIVAGSVVKSLCTPLALAAPLHRGRGETGPRTTRRHPEERDTMADIDIEKKKGGMGILPWILGLLLLGLILWGLTQCGDNEEEAVVVPAADTLTDPAAVAAPMPMDTGMAMADTTAMGAAGAAAGALPIAAVLANPGQYGSQAVSGTARVTEVISDRGFWVEDAGQRMFVVIAEPQASEQAVDINAGQTVRLSGQVREGSAAGQVTGLEAEAQRVAQGQPAFLMVNPSEVSVATP